MLEFVHLQIEGVVVSMDELIGSIQSDRVRRLSTAIDLLFSFEIYRPTNNSVRASNNRCLQNQLLIRCLSRTKPHPMAFNRFIDNYQSFSKNNLAEQQLLVEFEKNYCKNRALEWYFTDQLLPGLLSKALHSQNVENLNLLHFFLYDVNNEIHNKQLFVPIHTYRAQIVTNEDFETLKKGQRDFITMNVVLSTTSQEEKARSELNEMSNLPRVLFEITAEPQVETIHSYCENEENIYFTIGSSFLIDQIHIESNQQIRVILKFGEIDDPQMKNLQLTMGNSFQDTQMDICTLGDVLWSIGKLNESEQYYQRLLKDLHLEQRAEKAHCYFSLGNIAMDKNKLDLSFDYHQRALEIRQEIFRHDHPSLADSYKSIADLQRKRNKYDDAIEFYKRALDIWERNPEKYQYKIAMCLNNIGCIYGEAKEYQTTLNYYQRSLEIMKTYFASDHIFLGQIYHNIGCVLRSLGKLDSALDHYQMSLKIKSNVLSSQNGSVITTLRQIASTYEEMNLFKQAIEHYEKIATIYRQQHSLKSPEYLQVQEDIRRISNKLNR